MRKNLPILTSVAFGGVCHPISLLMPYLAPLQISKRKYKLPYCVAHVFRPMFRPFRPHQFRANGCSYPAKKPTHFVDQSSHLSDDRDVTNFEVYLSERLGFNNGWVSKEAETSVTIQHQIG